ncbi:hypothetical protein V8C43DRAFT_291528 [Trichoderma afarasin]
MTRMRRHRGRLQDASRRAVPFCARPDLSLSRHEGERGGICHMGHLVRWHLLRSVVEVVSGGNSSFKCEVVALGISSGLWMSVLVLGARLQPQGGNGRGPWDSWLWSTYRQRAIPLYCRSGLVPSSPCFFQYIETSVLL